MAKFFVAPEAAEARYKRYAKGEQRKPAARVPGRAYCAVDECPRWAPSGICPRHERALNLR